MGGRDYMWRRICLLYTSKIGDEYEIPPRDIEGYKLVEQDEEGNIIIKSSYQSISSSYHHRLYYNKFV